MYLRRTPRFNTMKPYCVYDQVTQQFVGVSGANPVNIAGCDGFEFFVHPVLLGNGTWGNAWVVSEATTGTRISSRWGKPKRTLSPMLPPVWKGVEVPSPNLTKSERNSCVKQVSRPNTNRRPLAPSATVEKYLSIIAAERETCCSMPTHYPPRLLWPSSRHLRTSTPRS